MHRATMLLSSAFVFAALLSVTNGVCPHGILKKGVSAEDQKVIVNLHNDIRKMIANGQVKNQPRGVNLKRMSWDDCLAKEAQRIAEKCEFAHAKASCSGYSWIGQNLYISYSTADTGSASHWKDAINSWFDEHKVYKFGSPFSSNTGHYTQLVWADTNKVGCGFAYYMKDGGYKYQKLYVCNYGPGGNWVGQAPYKTGKSGSRTQLQSSSTMHMYTSILAGFCFVIKISQIETSCPYGIMRSGVNNDEKNTIINMHNDVRIKVARGELSGQPRGVNLKRMSWDDCLANEAQRIANNCEFKHQSATCPAWNWVGQNLFSTWTTDSSDTGSDWPAAINGFIDEYKTYTFGQGFNHYTQVVWANTDRVGCGFTYFRTDGNYPYQKLYVCNYGPGGNIGGQTPYQTGNSGCENLC
ncbi:ancylostoma secreted protein [Aethina tumida]|uniref:ancylostoma secreted protein n=1 Tax=Aethina tumida TaxID=116153 RepID=UPI00096B1DBF|nr:ancylostoma secreted protein [Aethina tumida]